ncbi:unnamed protein product [Protopolystoma xenopodis]|uniref:Uncharacterized protein n=1 Tax=Protopolystoma xenopodis TaxID=117903 RepID=A0A3S5FDH8_9PLAT|nr:unnamed protein product [Protopolystoma xenopodis]
MLPLATDVHDSGPVATRAHRLTSTSSNGEQPDDELMPSRACSRSSHLIPPLHQRSLSQDFSGLPTSPWRGENLLQFTLDCFCRLAEEPRLRSALAVCLPRELRTRFFSVVFPNCCLVDVWLERLWLALRLPPPPAIREMADARRTCRLSPSRSGSEFARGKTTQPTGSEESNRRTIGLLRPS